MRKPNNKAAVAASPAQLEAKASDQLAQQNYRDAIATYKQLMATGSNPAWVAALCQCYAARASELEGKGMFAEAVIILEHLFNLNRQHQVVQDAQATVRYVNCLIKSGRVGRAANVYLSQREMIDSQPEAKAIESHFAAYLLSGHAECVKAFPADTALRQHSDIAKDALAAYCKGDDAQVEHLLKLIPFRSPFKDVSLLLKALIALGEDRAAAAEVLRRIPASSAFHEMAGHLLAATRESVSESVRLLAEMPAGMDKLIAQLKGWNKSQLSVVNKLMKGLQASTPQASLQALLSLREYLPEADFRRAAVALAVDAPVALIPKLNKQGLGLSDFEISRIHALHLERNGKPLDAVAHWADAIDEMEDGSEQAPLSRVEKAAVCKRFAGLIAKHNAGHYWRMAHTPASALEKALEFDSADLSTHIDLIHHYTHVLQDNGRKDLPAVLDRALKCFPENRDILTAAIESARERKAYKKAAGHAKKLLAIDPLNQSARQLLMDSHLDHARKQLNAKKFPLAEKEIAEAETFGGDNESQLAVQALRGWFAWIQGHKAVADKHFKEVGLLAGEPLMADLRLLAEGLRLKQTHKQINAVVPSKKKVCPLSPEQLISVLEFLKQQIDANGPDKAFSLLRHADASIFNAFRGLTQESDFEIVGEYVHGFADSSLLSQLVTPALRRYPENPLFGFLAIYCQCHGSAVLMKLEGEEKIVALYRRAQQMHHRRALSLIEEFLANLHSRMMSLDEIDDDDDFDNPFGDEFGGGLDGMPEPEDFDAVVAMLGKMIGQLPPAEAKRIEKALQNGDVSVLNEIQAKVAQAMYNPDKSVLPAPGKVKDEKPPRRQDKNQLPLFDDDSSF